MRGNLDAVIVGSGPNGLAAAVTLAAAGLKVQVIEGAPEIGGGCRTQELTLPGFRHDVCSAAHPLAVAWRREPEWLRYATAFNWCQWAVPLAAGAALLLVAVMIALGLPQRIGVLIVLLALLGYALALHWFIARSGLRLSAMRAAVLVVLVNLGTAILVLGPGLLSLGAREG